ncbi:MAG TPA: hypothetical protein VM889_05315 [Candidatus Thermoplasmatota archaeon]|nr:hypothetical protein [Candidatus Thermoplasmatota archaeon]
MAHAAARLGTGSVVLDQALDGGFPVGALVVLDGEPGAGAPELAWTVLAAAASENMGRELVYASAARSEARLVRERNELFPGRKEAFKAKPLTLAERDRAGALLALAGTLGRGDVLVAETTATLGDPKGVDALARALGDQAADVGFLAILVHAAGTLDGAAHARLADAADALAVLRWRDAGTVRRRHLWMPKARGLVSLLEAEEVPVFEVSLRKGAGFVASKIKSVM